MILYANGCSFTVGEDLTNPCETSWPSILSKKMNIEVINDASSGSSNDRIFRTTNDFLFDNVINNLNKKNEYMIVIGWSTIYRYEIYSSKYSEYLKILKLDNDVVSVIPDCLLDNEYKTVNDFINSYTFNPTDTLKTLNYIICLLSICKAYSIPCMMFNAIDPFPMYKKNFSIPILNKFKNLSYLNYHISLISNKVSYLLQQPEWCSKCFLEYCRKMNLSLGPKRHPLERGHEMWAEYLYEHFISHFPKINLSV